MQWDGNRLDIQRIMRGIIVRVYAFVKSVYGNLVLSFQLFSTELNYYYF